jgi:two-component system response regulator PilR (NtrC family)
VVLAEHFLKRLRSEHNRPLELSKEAIQWLESYDFPGNVRELENILERAVALSSSTTIGVADLPDLKSQRPMSDVPTTFPAEGIDLDRVLSDVEREWVTLALAQTQGVRKRAATLLGISFRSLRYRLAKLGFDKGDEKAEDEPE